MQGVQLSVCVEIELLLQARGKMKSLAGLWDVQRSCRSPLCANRGLTPLLAASAQVLPLTRQAIWASAAMRGFRRKKVACTDVEQPKVRDGLSTIDSTPCISQCACLPFVRDRKTGR